MVAVGCHTLGSLAAPPPDGINETPPTPFCCCFVSNPHTREKQRDTTGVLKYADIFDRARTIAEKGLRSNRDYQKATKP